MKIWRLQRIVTNGEDCLYVQTALDLERLGVKRDGAAVVGTCVDAMRGVRSPRGNRFVEPNLSGGEMRG